MKRNNIKLKIFIITLVLLFGIFLYFFLKSYDYRKEYNVNEFKVTESYNTKLKQYKFIIEYKNIKYPYVSSTSYSRNRGLIINIDKLTMDDEICIVPTSKIINDFYTLCSNKNELYSGNLSSNKDNKLLKIDKLSKEYNNIKINYIGDYTFLLYNYRGFYYINKYEEKEIKLFNNDIYRLDLIYFDNNGYLIIPDYNQNYYFDKFFIIDNKGRLKELKLEHKISFDSMFLGELDHKIYLLDKKEQKEYKINPERNTIEEVNYMIIEDNKLKEVEWKQIKIYKLNNNINKEKYYVKNNNLYRTIDKINIKLSDIKIDKYLNDNYYISKDKLYVYLENYGDILLLEDYEWNFNNTNMVWIY